MKYKVGEKVFQTWLVTNNFGKRVWIKKVAEVKEVEEVIITWGESVSEPSFMYVLDDDSRIRTSERVLEETTRFKIFINKLKNISKGVWQCG